MNTLIIGLLLFISSALIWLMPNLAPGALLMCAVVSAPTILILARTHDEKTFLLRLFLIGLMVRIVLGAVINMGHMEEFFGGDANTYDIFGQSLLEGLQGNSYHMQKYESFVASGAGAWGMLYLVAGIYQVVGRNLLAVQFVNASDRSCHGCCRLLHGDVAFQQPARGKARRSFSHVLPVADSLVVAGAQRWLDHPCARGVDSRDPAAHGEDHRWMGFSDHGSLLTLLSLRFYIFYMMTAAVAGSFVMGMKTLSAQSFVQRFVAVVAIGLAFTWFGVLQYAGNQFDRFANLKQIQLSRQDQSGAGSGFGKDVDITTTEGALSVIPLGIVYLLFAPFPWQFTSLRQSITLPEMIVWWLAFPLLVLGMWYSIKHD